MKQIDARTVELESDEEVTAKQLFDKRLDRGDDIPAAVARTRLEHPNLSDQFFQWLGR